MEMSKDEMFKPMNDYIPKKYWNDLMYMGNEGDIYLYKHYDTRCYINVDSKGRFYSYIGSEENKYIEISKHQAILDLNIVEIIDRKDILNDLVNIFEANTDENNITSVNGVYNSLKEYTKS